ncbi:hypothetical protein WR25_08075 isoform A [Diploscapter pachys]|uniref:Sialin n=1 Tax=Diploscapter pachys TaxID=2018661 RepID=A0A2A2J4A2_9BILA|nr:hypothetical protein WR25_08075 isoform A [Diploscapter pachys]
MTSLQTTGTSYGTAEDGIDEGGPVGAGKWRMARRHFVTLLALFGFANIYAMRANLSIAIVEMTTGTNYQLANGTTIHERGGFENWSPVTQGVVLGSFFYGYILTQIPGGYLAHHYGGRTIFMLGVLGTAVFTLLTPPLAKIGYPMLVIARLAEGFCEGVTYPAMHAMWSHWAPALEKTKLATFAFSGSYFGTVISMPLSAVIGQHLGWPSIFYFFGLLALLWCFIWLKKVTDYPSQDPQITTEELTLLQRDAISQSQYIVPWREILRSGPVWAITTAHFCQNWGFYIMLTSLPKMLKDLANYELQKAGVVSSLPYLLMGVCLVWGGQLSDYLRKEVVMDTLIVRRRFTAGGFIGQAICLVLASVTSSQNFLVAYLSISIGLGGITWAGFSVNHLDLAPQYSGHLMGFSNTVATLPGMVCPVIVGWIVQTGVGNIMRESGSHNYCRLHPNGY